MPVKRRSAGILPAREVGGELQVFLVHPGGPFFVRKDEGVWSIAKGLVDGDEDLLSCAKRELAEETGISPPEGLYLPLGSVKQKGGKIVEAWAVAADFDASTIRSNTFELEWPRGSGKIQSFPEVDRAAWLDLEAAAKKILPAQRPFLDRVAALRGELFRS